MQGDFNSGSAFLVASGMEPNCCSCVISDSKLMPDHVFAC